jgi:hypothetical protein
MSKRMKDNITFLAKLKHASPARKRQLIANSGSKEMATISEISKNLLHNRFRLNPEQLLKLSRHRKLVRQLASRATDFKSKKRALLQRGGFPIIPLLISTVAPLISSLIASRIGVKKK